MSKTAEKKSLQIDAVRLSEENPGFMECNLYVGGRCVRFYLSEPNYRALIHYGVFIRDGKEPDSAGVLNTTKVFLENE